MPKTMNDCFYENCKDKIESCLEQLPDDDDDTFDDYLVDKEVLYERIVEENFNNDCLYNTDVECLNIINNDVRIFLDMIKFIKIFDEDYEFNEDVIRMFHLFTYFWIRDNINMYEDMITEAIETECTERSRQTEVIKLTPLVINRTNIPNQLTQDIMAFIGIKA